MQGEEGRRMKTSEEQTEVKRAKESLRESFYRASPARIIERYPLRSAAAFTLIGFFAGSPRRARDGVIGAVSLISACTKLASIYSGIVNDRDE